MEPLDPKKAYYLKNKERILALYKQRYEENKEVYKVKNRDNYQKNIQKRISYQQMYYQKNQELLVNLTRARRLALKEQGIKEKNYNKPKPKVPPPPEVPAPPPEVPNFEMSFF